MPRRILLVESDLQHSAAIEQVLVQAGYSVTAVPSFEAASLPASRSQPDLVITAVRLGRFNGLHLAVRFRADYPGLPIIVIGNEEEVGLAAEAKQLQARFVPQSTSSDKVLEFIDELLSGRMPRDLVSTRRWPRRKSALPAHLAQTDAWVVDVGYGGMRLECASPPVQGGKPVHVRLPTVGMVVKGTFRWSRPSDKTQSYSCGFQLDATSVDPRKWRRVVDSLRES